jgi:hypothetical protein
MARPSSYTIQIAERICSELAQGRSLNSLVKETWCPDYTTICRWLRANEEFCQMYADARIDQGTFNAEEIKDLADESPEYVTVTTGDDRTETRVDAAWVQWQKNRIDARKWIAVKLNPRVYGERSHATVEAVVKKAKPATNEEMVAEIAELTQALGMKYQLVEIVDEEGEEE